MCIGHCLQGYFIHNHADYSMHANVEAMHFNTKRSRYNYTHSNNVSLVTVNSMTEIRLLKKILTSLRTSSKISACFSNGWSKFISLAAFRVSSSMATTAGWSAVISSIDSSIEAKAEEVNQSMSSVLSMDSQFPTQGRPSFCDCNTFRPRRELLGWESQASGAV